MLASVACVINKSSAILPITCEQAFDLAADIEKYPEFLSGWISARIVQRDGDRWCVEQIVGIGPLRVSFSSRAVLDPPRRIDVTSSEAPFESFNLSWLIDAVPPAGCRVSIIAAVELRSRMLQRMVKRMMPAAVDDVVAAFEARARRVRGEAPPVGRG